ncbi:butyryl-CoA dehydrogenase [Desulfotomaculum arcticum]|uniref:Butyryl-CoA dehydrogenase n=1 Tax=Desulfotruncus arcticus DSM 17038 TaxID=1121424 RepID=A0A1I2YIY5_9FIRM|nr:acyl-CoA dehydrogenase family protein [Desulfotruncus arcticus]SFH24511.1 butyryl-CoA dehydrogenase [Desulfotomaculum arcticum] [Desulfotruncus arcticus DSM 17038]
MEFTLSETQLMIRDMVRDFARNEVAPLTQELDKSGDFPLENYRKAAELGILGMTLPEEIGDVEADMVSYVLAIEELAKASASLADSCMLVDMLASLLYKYGSQKQKDKFIQPLIKGEIFGCFAVTEPNAGSDVAGMRTTAVQEDDHWVINGSKMFINNAPIADMAIVYAVTDKEKGSRGGVTAFIVENGTPGFSRGKAEDLMGQRSLKVGQLFFEDVKVPQENILGNVGEGFKMAMSVLDSGRIEIAALALGIAQAALEESVKYSKERVQFGRPIAKFQAIQWKLADMATQIQAARLLIYHAAYLKDQGQNYTKEAAMAKLFASDVANKVTNEAVQIHGGYGYIKEYVVERLYRDAKITQIYEGTNEIQRVVIARQLLKD